MAFFCKLVCFIRCCTSILNRGSKKDAAAASYSKALKKQQESYPASESRKAENAAKNDITALGTKYVTYVMKSNAYHEFWGLDLKNGEDPDTDGRSEYDAYEFLPANEFYWVGIKGTCKLSPEC